VVKRGRGVKMARVGLVKVPVVDGAGASTGEELAAFVQKGCGRRASPPIVGWFRPGVASDWAAFVVLEDANRGESVLRCDARLLEPLHAAIGQLLGKV
jgi:hypothetical protein